MVTSDLRTPSSHHKIFPHYIFVQGLGCPEAFLDRQFDGGAKIFQGLGPKVPESCDGNWVYVASRAEAAAVGGPRQAAGAYVHIVSMCMCMCIDIYIYMYIPCT